jgi:TolB-like protein/DNA-binding winged helix-turn-helix (wHTH) protein/tetratricopeptide (TPR) repeat protein
MASYRFLEFGLSEEDFSLSRNGQRIALEPKALRVLILLVSRAGCLVTKPEVLESVWPNTFVEENTLARTIGVLRRELGDTSRDSKLIETVPTRGYRFIAPVEVVPVQAPDSPATQIRHPVSGSDSQSSATVVPAIRTTIPKLTWISVTACLILAAIIGSLWIRHLRQPTDRPIRSLAVLPLNDLSPGTREEYFADGMTDELITELARIPGLRVVSRTSAMQNKGTHKSLEQIARELDVDAIVEGSVVRSDDRVRITAQLIDTRSDKHLWAQSFEGPLDDVLSLQGDVAREIASQTRIVLTPAAQRELTHAKHIHPEANDAYLRGLYFIQRRDGVMAASHFREAIALQPGYAEAHAGLAEALVSQFILGQARVADVMPAAVTAAKRAVELDPNSGEAYTALGAVDKSFLWDWNAAEQNLRKGIALSPSNSNAESWLAVYLMHVNRPAEAVEAARRAVSLDPLSFWANRNLGMALFYARRYDEALAALKRASEIAPDKSPLFVEGWNSAIYEVEGRYADAMAADLKNITDLSPAEVDSHRSAFENGGWKAYQKTLVKVWLPRSTKPCGGWELSMTYLRLGDSTEAFRWFNRQVDEHCPSVLTLSIDPRFDTIRKDAPYSALLSRMHLPH